MGECWWREEEKAAACEAVGRARHSHSTIEIVITF